MQLTTLKPCDKKEVAITILLFGTVIQFLGVSASLVGLFWLKDIMGPQEKRNIFLLGSPIWVAYGIALASLARLGYWQAAKKITTISSTKALKHVVHYFIIGGTILLGSLVYITGGAKTSIFTPIFLLIPTLAACYCKPRGLYFWGIIASNVCVYLYLSMSGGINSVNITNTFDYANIWAGSITATCIITAAACHGITHWIRNEYCVNNNPVTNCSVFYL